jgi:hypothetical protein
MKTTICDACGKTIRTASGGGIIETLDPHSFLIGDPENKYDLCSDCYKIIKNILIIATEGKNNILEIVDWAVTNGYKENMILQAI